MRDEHEKRIEALEARINKLQDEFENVKRERDQAVVDRDNAQDELVLLKDVGTDIPDSTFLALVRAGIVDYNTGCAMTTHDLFTLVEDQLAPRLGDALKLLRACGAPGYL